MKKFLPVFLIFSFFFGAVGQAQPIYINWTKYIGGLGGDGSWHATGTSDSGVVFVGRTTDTLGGGDVPASPPDSQSIVANNLIIGKLDSNKQLSWLKVYGGRRMDQGIKVIQVADGGYAVLAQTESYSGDVSFNRGSQEIWLLRLDSLGNLLWEKTYGSSTGETPLSLAETDDNGFIILATSLGSDYDVPFHYGSSSFSYDWFIVKTDSVGNLQWARTLGGTGDDNFASGSIFQLGSSYYMIGSSSSRDNDCTDTSWHAGVDTDMDIFMLKLDSAGDPLWNKSFGGTGLEDWSTAIFDSRDSSIVVSVRSTSHDYMVANSYAVPVFWVFKTDLNGNMVWATVAGDSLLYSIPTGILPYKDSMYLVTTFGSDYWVSILQGNGIFNYYKRVGGPLNEMNFPTVVPYKSGYAVVGTTSSPSMFEGGLLNDRRNSIDVFVSGLNDVYAPLDVKTITTGNKKITVYPNPASNTVRITMPGAKGNLTIKDSGGKTVYKDRLRNSSAEIYISAWPKGLYMVVWESEDGERATEKLINN